MASKKENLKALFSNTRSRVIIVFTLLLLVITIVIGVIKIRGTGSQFGEKASLTSAPSGIQSIPGGINPTAQYVHLQEAQNVNQARAAMESGGSAIPTLIRSQKLGGGAEVIGSAGGVGFATLSRETTEGGQHKHWLDMLREAHCSKEVLAKVLEQGGKLQDFKDVCDCAQLKNIGYMGADLQNVCSCQELKALGFSARQFKDANFTADKLRDCGLSACEVRGAGYSAKEMQAGGFTAGELKGAGFAAQDIKEDVSAQGGPNADAIRKAGCDPEALKALRAAGVSAAAIHDRNNCTAAALKAAGYTAADLKGAGFTASDLRSLGISPKELKEAGFSADALKVAGASAAELKEAGFDPAALKQAGFTAADLKAAGLTAGDLKKAGFNAAALKNAGFDPRELRSAGFSADQLKAAGFDPQALAKAGFSNDALRAAGFSNADLHQPDFGMGSLPGTRGIPGVPGMPNQQAQAASNSQQLQAMMERQNQQMLDQRFQQRIQQRLSEMTGFATQSLQGWQKAALQVYIEGNEKTEKEKAQAGGIRPEERMLAGGRVPEGVLEAGQLRPERRAMIKMGDILFAVLDTSVNSDEPGPILATIVSGKLKGTKLIGSFTLPKEGDKMVISFNAMSIPGAPRSIGVSAYAIDPDTARTALASRANHHYLLRYGSLFASSFLEGFGNAFQSANTTVTVGGTGGGNNVTVQNGINRSALQNAVIGLATLGKSWGQAAQQQFNRPTTVELFSGSGLGILFTQDVASFN